MTDVFVDVADTLVGDFDLIEFLDSLAGHAAEISEGVAAGVMLSGRDGTLHHVGASSADAGMLELLQLQSDEGPCLDCFRTGEPVVVPDLAAAGDRWPVFTPRALDVGVGAVHAFPMRHQERLIGGLNVFLAPHRTLTGVETRVLRGMTGLATIALLQEQAVTRAETLTEQLQVALDSRIVVEQAKGALAKSLGVTVEEAFERLRSHARRTRRRLTDVAHEVVAAPDVTDTCWPNDLAHGCAPPEGGGTARPELLGSGKRPAEDRMALQKGDSVAWNTPQGQTTGTVVQRRTSDFQFEGQQFRASEDEPAFIVESDKTGARAAHKESGLTRR